MNSSMPGGFPPRQHLPLEAPFHFPSSMIPVVDTLRQFRALSNMLHGPSTDASVGITAQDARALRQLSARLPKVKSSK